jgi:RND superfamily putative drug exporter
VIAGDSTEAADRVDPTLAAVAAAQAKHPALDIEQVGGASANKAINQVIGDDLKKAGELSLPVTLIILTITFGTLVAAGVPLLIGITAVLAALGLVALPSGVLPVDTNLPAVILMIGLAVGVDYSLFYLRREREERAAGRSERAALIAAAATSGRAVLISGVHGHRRDGRHVDQRRQVVHLLRRGRDPRGRDRDVRVADRAARPCCRGSATASRRVAFPCSAVAAACR